MNLNKNVICANCNSVVSTFIAEFAEQNLKTFELSGRIPGASDIDHLSADSK